MNVVVVVLVGVLVVGVGVVGAVVVLVTGVVVVVVVVVVVAVGFSVGAAVVVVAGAVVVIVGAVGVVAAVVVGVVVRGWCTSRERRTREGFSVAVEAESLLCSVFCVSKRVTSTAFLVLSWCICVKPTKPETEDECALVESSIPVHRSFRSASE